MGKSKGSVPKIGRCMEHPIRKGGYKWGEAAQRKVMWERKREERTLKNKVC